jgi:glycosyltransferase involved in cell wall biosynthesis
MKMFSTSKLYSDKTNGGLKTSKSLNILMIYELGPVGKDFSGGIEAHIMNFAERLTQMGHNVLFLTGSIPGAKKTYKRNGIRFKRVDWLGLISKAWNQYKLTTRRQLLFLLITLRELIKLKQNRFDIVHGHIYTSGLLAYLFGKIKKIPSVNTIHGSYFDVWNIIEKNPIKAKFFKIMEKLLVTFLARHCTYQIHTDTAFAKKAIHWTRKQKKIKIILNGVDITLFSPNKDSIQGLKDSRPLIMTVRRLVKKNGVEFLLKAVPLVLKTKDVKIIVVGDGPEREELLKLTSKLNLSNNVTFIGGIPNFRVPNYLSAADIIVVPSIVEASSISVLEAMAMEKPIIASDIPGIKDVIDCSNCYLVPTKSPIKIAEAILRMLDNPLQSKKLGKNTRKIIEERHSWIIVAKRIERLYRRALSELFS